MSAGEEETKGGMPGRHSLQWGAEVRVIPCWGWDLEGCAGQSQVVQGSKWAIL